MKERLIYKKLASKDGENKMTLSDDYYEVNKAIYDAINCTEC